MGHVCECVRVFLMVFFLLLNSECACLPVFSREKERESSWVNGVVRRIRKESGEGKPWLYEVFILFFEKFSIKKKVWKINNKMKIEGGRRLSFRCLIYRMATEWGSAARMSSHRKTQGSTWLRACASHTSPQRALSSILPSRMGNWGMLRSRACPKVIEPLSRVRRHIPKPDCKVPNLSIPFTS